MFDYQARRGCGLIPRNHSARSGRTGPAPAARIAAGIALAAALLLGLGSSTAHAAACAAPNSGETRLEAAARGLAPGQWCELPAPATSILKAPNLPDNLLTYGHGMAWDPAYQTLSYTGFVYGGGNYWAATFTYQDGAGNGNWYVNETFTQTGNGHYYDTWAYVHDTPGKAHIRRWLTNGISTCNWNNSSKTWNCGSGEVASAPGDTCGIYPNDDVTALEWDPSRNGMVLFADGANSGKGEVCFWNRANNSWSKDAGPISSEAISAFNFSATYTHADCDATAPGVQPCVWLQSQSRTQHWKNQGGDVTRMNSTAPFNLGCCSGTGGNSSLTCADPVSGLYVVNNQNGFYQYDIANDSWSNLGSRPPVDFATKDESCAADSTHGLILYLDCTGGATCPAPKFYAYKHSPSAPPTDPPDAPANLEAD